MVYELKDVLDDLEKGNYERTMVKDTKVDKNARGEITVDRTIKFDNVPLITPNGDYLLNEPMNFEIKPGMNLMISGPNGCGKSSMFRLLGGLWPIFGGKMTRPGSDQIFYIPQRPYLPNGNLRDQIIYPHDKLTMMKKKNIMDRDLREIVKKVKLESIIDREGGWDSVNDWNDVLSGGEKQRMAMARLIYHKPTFALLDECTSAVSVDVEGFMYTYAKEIGITLITISHRPTLWKYHDYLLKFDGTGSWEFEKMKQEVIAQKES